jgi:tape measure domain-containing protein
MATEVATLLFEADTRPLRSANDELSKTERAGVRAESAAKKMGTELKKAANDSINPIQKVNSSISALSAAVTALAGALVVRQFIAYTDQWTDLNAQLVNATGSAEAANEALQAISETATRTFSSIKQTTQGFLQNNLVLRELGYTTGQQVELMAALNNSFVISGAKGEQAAMIMGAFGRAMAQGTLKGQELNLMLTYSARTVQALADGLGVTTIELRKMVAAGEIDATAMFEGLTSQASLLTQEADAMAATIGDAFVILGNFALESVGRLDQAAGLSESIADTILRAISGFRKAYNPTDQEYFNSLHEEFLHLQDQINRKLMMPSRRPAARQRIKELEEEMAAMNDANVARQTKESETVAAGLAQRAQAEAQRLADHQAELARIEAEKQARAAASRQATVDTQAQRIAESLLSQEDQIKLSYERQRDTILDSTQITGDKRRELLLKLTQLEIDALDDLYQKNADREKALEIEKFARLVENNRKITELENNVRQERINAAAQQTQQLLEFDNVLLRNKSQTSQAAFRMSVSLMNEEKRMAAGKIISDSYAAAMAAWKSLASIPFIGPALGAAAAGGIIAAGVSYSAKSLAGRALGGQVRAGQSYVVGERGPEVLTMGSTNGKVIPNSSINQTQATGTINRVANVSFNITANDATGFDQLLNASRGKIIDIVNNALNDNGREALL